MRVPVTAALALAMAAPTAVVHAAPRLRLTCRQAADGTLDGRSEVAPPGRPDAFVSYLSWRARRAGGGTGGA